jgi:chaperonin cofactor prefoldin
VIQLEQVRAILRECEALIDELDGLEHDDSSMKAERGSVTRKQADREHKTYVSKSLLFLDDRLRLAASLVSNEYWFARGERDAFNADREEPDVD